MSDGDARDHRIIVGARCDCEFGPMTIAPFGPWAGNGRLCSKCNAWMLDGGNMETRARLEIMGNEGGDGG